MKTIQTQGNGRRIIMRYIRTKGERIIDLEKFINEEKYTPYYKDFVFEKITNDGVLKWTAVGTEKCSIKDQIGRKCHFHATVNSDIINQSDTIEDLCDKWVYDNNSEEKNVIKDIERFSVAFMKNAIKDKKVFNVKLAIFTDKGLIYVAKMNEKGELELL